MGYLWRSQAATEVSCAAFKRPCSYGAQTRRMVGHIVSRPKTAPTQPRQKHFDRRPSFSRTTHGAGRFACVFLCLYGRPSALPPRTRPWAADQLLSTAVDCYTLVVTIARHAEYSKRYKLLPTTPLAPLSTAVPFKAAAVVCSGTPSLDSCARRLPALCGAPMYAISLARHFSRVKKYMVELSLQYWSVEKVATRGKVATARGLKTRAIGVSLVGMAAQHLADIGVF